VTVPHCYASVVLNTLEISIEVGVGVEVEFIVTSEGTHVAVRGSTEINRTARAEVTSIVTGNTRAMGSDAILKAMRGTSGGSPLINFREMVGMRGCYMNMGVMRRSELRGRGKTGTRSNTRTSSRGIAMTTLMSPFTTIVARAVEGWPKRL